MIISSVLVASDKFISEEFSTRIKRFLNMTKIEKIFKKEKIEYANERVNVSLRENNVRTAKILLNRGIDIIPIMEATGLSEQELMNLQEESVTV
jgi:hypothetical protein